MSVIRDHRDEVSSFLDEYRRTDRKNEIISRDYLISHLIERHPHLSSVSQTALKRTVTALVEEKGGKRLEKKNSCHLKYLWPIPPEEAAPS